MKRKFITPGTFGENVAADDSRILFDIGNEELYYTDVTPDYIFIGDSVIRHWEFPAYFKGGLYMLNRGIGGDTTKYILKRSDADVFQFKPKNIVYMAGINDLINAQPDYWWRKPGRDLKEVRSEISSNSEEFMKKCVGCELYVCSLLPTDIAPPFNKERINKAIVSVNNSLKKLCKKYRATYVDFHSAFCCDDKLTMKNGLTHDGVHPDGKGYAIMAEILKKSAVDL